VKSGVLEGGSFLNGCRALCSVVARLTKDIDRDKLVIDALFFQRAANAK
jgi:hypothetical protein